MRHASGDAGRPWNRMSAETGLGVASAEQLAEKLNSEQL
jgi:hypothetical protein